MNIYKKLFKTADYIPYAIVEDKEQVRTLPVFSQEMDAHIVQHHLVKNGSVPKKAERDEFKTQIAAKALYESDVMPVWVRIAETEGAVEIDLNNETGKCIRITQDKWEITTPQALFYRPNTLQTMQEPVAYEDWKIFKKHFKVKTDQDLQLLIAFMISCLRPNAPSYLTLVLQGEQGTAKSTTARMLKRIIDPAKGETRTLPRSEQDLFIAAKNNHLVSFDNVSLIKNNISDTLCMLATGGTFAARSLYTNDEEHMIELCKPVLLNGITDFVTRPDLADRSLSIELEPIPVNERKPSNEVMECFKTDLPKMLGVLMNAISSSIRNIDNVKLDELPRMADVALWCTAAEEGLGWHKGSFIRAYSNNRENAVITQLSNDPVAIALRSFVAGHKANSWEGTATQLMAELETHKPSMDHARSWPNTPSYLSDKLSRLAPNIRTIGINIHKSRTQHQRTITIEKTEGFERYNPSADNTPEIFKMHKEVILPNSDIFDN